MKNAVALFIGVTALCLLTPLAASAQQALSKSMVECAVIYEEVAVLGLAKGQAEQEVARFRDGSAAFLKAASTQAVAENQPDPDDYLQRLQDDLRDKWAGRLSSALHLTENKDWIDYCKALERDRGL